MNAQGWRGRARGAVGVATTGGLCALACVLVMVSPAYAQVPMRREVPRGEVTGLEMNIEGSLEATPGAPVRWWVTLYEVLRRRDLRAAAGCTIRAMASHDRTQPIATATTGHDGRTTLTMPMPEGLVFSPHLVLDATCPRGVRRVFDVDLELAPRERVALVVDRLQVGPGEPALVIGRVLDRATGRGLPGVDVEVRAQQAGPVGGPRQVTTDSVGMFSLSIRAPRELGQLVVTARTVHERGASASESAAVFVAAPSPRPPLTIEALSTPTTVSPGTVVDLTIVVRGADGLPIEGATVTGPARVAPPRGETPPPIHTDARGVAHYPWWVAPDASLAAVSDVSTEVVVTSAALGTQRMSTSIRVARRRTFSTVAVEGGVLVPGAPARVFARVLGADGVPVASREVTLSAPILGSDQDGSEVARGRTDAEGMVAFDVTTARGASMDLECGGTTAAGLTLRVDGETSTLCVPVDPDALLVVRAPPRVAPGAELTVELHRTPHATGRAVVVTALRRGARGWEPFAQEIAGPHARTVTVPAINVAVGEIWVRARVIMADGQVVRGASTLVSFTEAPGAIRVEAGPEGARVQGAAADEGVLVLAMDEARAGVLLDALAGGASVDRASAGLAGLALEATLAVRVPEDLGASALLRGGEIVAQAMPEDPRAFGLLRDPWRTRARFVRGRLGRLFIAVEEMVERRIPDRLGEVASVGPRGWTWNREMLATAVAEADIDDEGSASLDGEPIDIDALVALEPSFTFDAVARRITRRRLFRVMQAMRQITHERNLDLPWARRGDPRTWITTLAGVDLPDGSVLDTEFLFDGWGRAFVFRPTSRRSFLPAIEGWEIASIGPDGRDGTPDDLFDPFVRAVPSGGLYAEAVGEDALVARLTGVAVSRAWVSQLAAEMPDVESEGWSESSSESVGLLAGAWAAAPSRLRVGVAPADVLLATQPGAYLGAERTRSWSLPTERQRYGAVAIAVPPAGRPRAATTSFEAGARVLLRGELPQLVRVGDTLSIPITVSALDGQVPPSVSLELRGEAARGRLSVQPVGDTGAAAGRLELEATGVGTIELVLTARPAGGADTDPPLVRRHRVQVLPGGALLATHASALLGPDDAISLGGGAPAVRALGATAVVVGPRSLDRLPFFTSLAQERSEGADARFVALAWSRALRGELDDELATRAALVANQGALADACALVALSTSSLASVPQVGSSLSRPIASTTDVYVRAADALRGRVGAGSYADARERAATLVALAPVVSPDASEGATSLGRHLANLRLEGWRVIATQRSDVALLARFAAGLLLANADDGPGRALYRVALDGLVRDGRGDRHVPGDPARVGDGWVGTLALAIAARQLGEDSVADELARSASRELHLLRRTGLEGAFWALAASNYGALGGATHDTSGDPTTGTPPTARIEVAGMTHEVSLTEAAMALPIARDAQVRSDARERVLVVLESRDVRELSEQSQAPFVLSVEGVLGDDARLGTAGGRAALELVVTTNEREVARPILEVELPSLASFDAVARTALLADPDVVAVGEPDRGGVLRIELAPLRSEQSVHLPLVFAWLGGGHVRGLGLVGYDAPSPALRTSVASRPIVITTTPLQTDGAAAPSAPPTPER